MTAEQIAKSKIALIICLIAGIAFLADQNISLSANNKELQSKIYVQATDLQRQIAKKDSIIYNCQQQEKIVSDNATKSAQAQANEYRGLWIEYVNIKSEARKKNIIK